MKAHIRALNGRLMIDVESDTTKGLFGQLAAAQEIFDADSNCGKCGSVDIGFRVRHSKAKAGKNAGKVYDYYELACRGCDAFLAFGQSADLVNLFPKRRDDDGNTLDDRGWTSRRTIAAPR